MSQNKPDDIMASYPTTNNTIESFHSTFKHAVPRQTLPLYIAVSMTYHYAQNCQIHAESIQEGTRKQNRKRGSQHERKKLPIALRKDEWLERPPESAKALEPKKKRR